MFGQNPSRSIVMSDGSLFEVQEIFHTLQGEGPFSGMPAVFVRFAGCNLRCTWCDTDFESAYQRTDVMMTKQAIIDRIKTEMVSGNLIVLTGGEPLRQNIAPLIFDIIDQMPMVHVQIETAGTIGVHSDLWTMMEVDHRVTLVCSPKTPKVHPSIKTFCHHWKYVLGADDVHPFDGLPFRSTQKAIGPEDMGKPLQIYRSNRPDDTIWVSPRDDHDPGKNLLNMKAAVDSCLEHGHRLSLQTHKVVGLP